MDNLGRSGRAALIAKALVERPGRLIPLGDFAASFGVARSTICEDVSFVREAFAAAGAGSIESTTGVAGGVHYLPALAPANVAALVEELGRALSTPERIVVGGFLFMSDVIFSPRWAAAIGEAFAGMFADAGGQFVITVETRGIPIALMTARALDVPLVILRRNAEASEGSAVSINYVSGSSERLQTMSLPRRALPLGARAVLVDDFMKGGGTARGVRELLAEFQASVAATGVVVETALPAAKLVSDYVSLLVLDEMDPAAGRIGIRPSPRLAAYLAGASGGSAP